MPLDFPNWQNFFIYFDAHGNETQCISDFYRKNIKDFSSIVTIYKIIDSLSTHKLLLIKKSGSKKYITLTESGKILRKSLILAKSIIDENGLIDDGILLEQTEIKKDNGKKPKMPKQKL